MIDLVILVSDNDKHFLASSKIQDPKISEVIVINLTNSPAVAKHATTLGYQNFNISNIINPVILLNNILHTSKSKYLLISTGSVTFYKNAIVEMLKYFDIHDRVAFVYSDYDFISNGKIEPRFQHPYDSRLIYANVLPSLIGLYKKDILKESDGFKESNQETFINLANKGLFFHHATSLFMDKQ